MSGLALLAAQAQAASAKDTTPIHSEDLQQRRSAVLSQTARRGSSHKSGQRSYGRGISVHVQVHGSQHEAGMPQDAQREGDERQKPLDGVGQRPRPRPIPLPPPSSSRYASSPSTFAASFQVGAGDTGTTGEDPLPALESMAPLSGLATTTAGTVDRSPSAKRRKVDHTPDHHFGLASSNITRAGVITNKSPRSSRIPIKPSPFFPVKVKNEPESPPLSSVERKTFPKRELEATGFQVGKYVVRGDDISIEWPSLQQHSSPSDRPSLVLPINASITTSTPTRCQSTQSAASLQKSPILASHPQLAYNHPIIPPSPAPTTSASPKPPPLPATPVALASSSPSASSLQTPPSTTTNASPAKRRRKRKRERVPCGELDLATAIRLSQRDNASPRPPLRRQTLSLPSSRRSSRSARSPASAAAATTYDSPTKAPRMVPLSGLARETSFAEDEVEVVHVGTGGEGGEGKDGAPAALEIGQASGWTVIQDIADPDRSDGVEEAVEEEHDQLVEEEDEEEDELREEMEAAEAISMDTTNLKDESGDERDEVENAAILDGSVSSPTMMMTTTEKVLPEVVPAKSELIEDTVWHGLSRDFLTKYMTVYETDRARLVSAYSPDAKLIYRVSEPPPPDAKTSRYFPLCSARGHEEISTFLHGLGWTHFTQKLQSEDQNREVDMEFRSERLDQGSVWLYVRSVMTMSEAQEEPTGGSDSVANRRQWSVDHSFLLRQGTTTIQGAMEDTWPLIAHVHQLVMHESTM